VTVSVDGSPRPTALAVTIEQVAGTHQLVSGTGFVDKDALVGIGTFTVSSGGTSTDFVTDESTTLRQLASQINAAGLGVAASAIQVSQSDYRILLSATESGSDGVFTASSDISAFSTIDTVSAGQDASARLGDQATGIQLTRSSNVFSNVVDGLTFTAKSVTTAPIELAVLRDTDAAAAAIAAVFTSANDLLSELADQTSYNAESQSASALTSDSTARDMILSLRSALSEATPNGGSFSTIGQIGVAFNRDGSYSVDEAVLRTSLETNFDDITSMFTSSNSGGGTSLTLLSSPTGLPSGSYQVVVDIAPESPTIIGAEFSSPTQLEEFNIGYRGIDALVTVSINATLLQAMDSIRQDLDTYGLTDVIVDSVAFGAGNALRISVPGAYGSIEQLSVSNDTKFGLDAVVAGVDIVGTIGGESSTGSGDVLEVASGDASGLRIRVAATPAEVGGGAFVAGSIGAVRGLGDKLDSWLDAYEGLDGNIARARGEWDARIEDVDDSIESFESRMVLREQSLRRQFTAMEQALAQLQGQGSFITSLLPGATP
jgi:flagellar hook-associated protein 2